MFMYTEIMYKVSQLYESELLGKEPLIWFKSCISELVVKLYVIGLCVCMN